MALDANAVETVTVDSYGTLVDVDSVERALAERVDDPAPIAALWRSRSLQYAFVANQVDAYRPFYEMNRAALADALAAHDVSLDADERDEILATYHELDVFEDVRDALERLVEAGYDVYVLSNGNPEMLSSMIDHAGIGDLLADAVSADEIATFKPAAEFYRHGADRTNTPVEAVAHVAAGWWDVLGAMHAGLQGVWVDRKGAPWAGFADGPDLEIASISEVADELEA